NLMIDYGRKRTFASLDTLLETSNSFDPSDPKSVPDGRSIDQEYAMNRLRQLDEHHFEILNLRFIQELTISEIASIYGDSENAVSVRIHRAVKQAKKLFANLEQDFYEQ